MVVTPMKQTIRVSVLHRRISQKPPGRFGMIPPSTIPVAYGFQGSSKKIDIPNGRVGVIIGKGGETIKYLHLQSGAKIQVTRDMGADPNSLTRMVELMGTPEQISKGEQLIKDVLAEAEAGGAGIVSQRLTGQLGTGTNQFTMKVPNNNVQKSKNLCFGSYDGQLGFWIVCDVGCFTGWFDHWYRRQDHKKYAS